MLEQLQTLLALHRPGEPDPLPASSKTVANRLRRS
jgi:hypothetical protein